MKVILTGSTGFIGSEVLLQAIYNPKITQIVCLSRRALPEHITSNPKVTVVIISDFTNYTPEILAQLEGAEACIWSMGAPPSKHPDLELCKKVEIEYTRIAAEAFTSWLPGLEKDGKSFRFVYLSGMFANRETDKKMWFLNDTRTNKGTAENQLLAINEKSKNFDVTIVRPGGVLAKGSPMPDFAINLAMSLKIEELAAVMVEEAVEGVQGPKTLENDALRKKGKELLK